MDVFDAIKNRRSVRNFRPDPIPNEVIDKLFEAAIWAPSHRNSQPWEFKVIGASTRQRLLPVFQNQLEGVISRNPDFTEERIQMMRAFGQNFGNAPLLIAVTSIPGSTPLDQFEFPMTTAMAVQNIFLAAWEKNIGSVWLSFPTPETRSILEIKEDYTLNGVLALGYFDAIPPALPREPVSSKVSYLP